jgi:hypothetical protein
MKTTKAGGGWKKILAVGCSHGVHADPLALDAVLRFKQKFNPDFTIHLGDAIDLAAMRSGAKGSNDESAPLDPDIDGGIEFLSRLRPNLFFYGNHEDRITRLCHSPNALVQKAADEIRKGLHEALRRIKCEPILYDAIYQGRIIGGVRYMHGVFYNENHCRDHAEAFGNVVFAHAHRAGVATGRRCDAPKGFCVGTLTRFAAMEYAKTRRATLGWSQGFVYGYYRDDQSQLWLHEKNPNAPWLLP